VSGSAAFTSVVSPFVFASGFLSAFTPSFALTSVFVAVVAVAVWATGAASAFSDVV